MDARDISEGSDLHVLVPQATEGEIGKLFAGEDGLNGDTDFASLLSIEQRQLLYFDELLAIYLVLQTPYQDEAQLKSYFSQLAIHIEARAYGFAPKGSGEREASPGNSPSRNEDVIWTGMIDAAEEPFVIVQEGKGEEDERSLIAVWKTEAMLSRPRLRLQSPMIIFKPTATLFPTQDSVNDALKDEYLQSGVPESMNLLQPLKGDPASHGMEPRLSASRLYRAQPFSSQADVRSRTLKARAPKPFPALPAISSRIRYHKSNSRTSKSSIVASLEFDTAPFAKDDVEITMVDMRLSEGSVENLARTFGPKLPLHCRPRDCTVYLYRLMLDGAVSETSSPSLARMANITINAIVLVSDECRPRIQMRWKTGVDFSTALNPTFGAPGPSMQRNKRPASLPVTLSSTNVNSMPSTARDEDPGADEHLTRKRAVSLSDLGVTMTFTSPRVVYVNQPFSWDVLVLNGSTRSRRLLINPIAKVRRGNVRGHSSKPSSSSVGGREETDTAEAVVDENILYALQKNARMEPSQVISLSADVRIGPLNAGSCVNVELKFVALVKGHHRIEAVQVVDVMSNDSVDIRDLPDIMAKDSVDKESI